MTPQKTPCRQYVQQGQPDLWFSDKDSEQTLAASLCNSLCPLGAKADCAKQGWNEEFGVWGGLTEKMRKRQDKHFVERARATAEAESLYIDDVVADIRGRVERERIIAAGMAEGLEIEFVMEDAA